MATFVCCRLFNYAEIRYMGRGCRIVDCRLLHYGTINSGKRPTRLQFRRPQVATAMTSFLVLVVFCYIQLVFSAFVVLETLLDPSPSVL